LTRRQPITQPCIKLPRAVCRRINIFTANYIIMKKGIALFLAAALLQLALHGQPGFQKLPSGLNYKIIKTGKGALPKMSNCLQVHTIQAIGDSAIFSTYSSGPSLIELNTPSLQNDFVRIFMMMRAGDSAVFYQTAKAIKKQLNVLPPFMKETDTLFGYCKSVKIFPSIKLAMAEKELQSRGQIIKEQVVIKEYLTQNKIDAKLTPKGSYIQISNPGTGAPVQQGATVSVMYKGQKFDSTIFDTNMQPGFSSTDPLVYQAGTGSMIPGFDEAIMLLKKGGTCKVFIPSTLAYAQSGSGAILPGENIMFDLELRDVQQPPAAAKKPAPKPKPPVKRKG
jgi:FKBP-type peptidyl-prolyl cis-trans isomerase FkpA